MRIEVSHPRLSLKIIFSLIFLATIGTQGLADDACDPLVAKMEALIRASPDRAKRYEEILQSYRDDKANKAAVAKLQNLAESLKTATSVTPIHAEMAEIYLSINRPFEAAWELKVIGRHVEADAILAKAEHEMLNGAYDILETVELRGQSKAQVVRYRVGLKGVRKDDVKAGDFYGLGTNVWHERAAYVLSKLLNLDLVPITVVRIENGIPRSIQYFISNAGSVQKAKGDHGFGVFDFLIRARDRHKYNKISRIGSRRVAIDNSASFGIDGAADAITDPAQVTMTRNIYRRMKEISHKELETLIKPLLRLAYQRIQSHSAEQQDHPFIRGIASNPNPDNQFNLFLQRWDALLAHFDERIRKEGEAKVFAVADEE